MTLTARQEVERFVRDMTEAELEDLRLLLITRDLLKQSNRSIERRQAPKPPNWAVKPLI